jgi:drug/metabolite transporter (DMT)-like permease
MEANMNQIPVLSKLPRATLGALYMVLAGIAFAIANVLTQIVTFQLGFKAQSDTFWQYFIALVFALPFLAKHGLAGLRTNRPLPHVLRIVLSALGVQAFVMSLANGVQIWQVIALVMTSPFFVMLGAWLFLGERVGPERWLAATVAFLGAMLILKPWASGFGPASLLPVAAAILWGGASLITKYLTKDETASAVTMWLLLLILPINAGLSVHAGFEVPTGNILVLLLIGGAVMLAAQYFLTKSYATADAAYVQPFDDLKLISNIVAGWLVFGYLPEGYVWIGVALILLASAYLLRQESVRERALKAA